MWFKFRKNMFRCPRKEPPVWVLARTVDMILRFTALPWPMPSGMGHSEWRRILASGWLAPIQGHNAPKSKRESSKGAAATASFPSKAPLKTTCRSVTRTPPGFATLDRSAMDAQRRTGHTMAFSIRDPCGRWKATAPCTPNPGTIRNRARRETPAFAGVASRQDPAPIVASPDAVPIPFSGARDTSS
uniref:Uncharacterized protein n=1 Tax=Candidatus Kentrum sp. TC TaxID=2126339 RepID=A0A450YFJ5_9GAMM|nr:MAG: hypothetical protein BECKTC1821D_GA0114238_100940 [Candidatus Kentron sp. TC]